MLREKRIVQRTRNFAYKTFPRIVPKPDRLYYRIKKLKRRRPRSFTPLDALISVVGGILVVLVLTAAINLFRNESIIEKKVLAQVNSDRVKMGQDPLLENEKLHAWAKRHSTLMHEENFFAHSDYDVGENILDTPAWYSTQNCLFVITNRQIADCLVKKWKISKAHYDNMFNPNYTLTGVGVSCSIFKCLATQQFR